MAEQSKIYRPDEAATVVMVPRPAGTAKPAAEDSNLRALGRFVPVTEPPELAVFDVGSSYRAEPIATAGAPQYLSGFVEISHEMGGGATVSLADLTIVRDAQLSELRLTTVSGSDREIWSAVRFGAGSPETDGTATTLTYQRVDAGAPLQRQTLVGKTITWSPKVPTAVRLADLDDEIAREGPDAPARQGLLEVWAAYDREKYEVWDPLSDSRIRREGTARPRLPEGRYRIGVESDRHYQPWGPSDEYMATTEAYSAGPPAVWPELLVAPAETTSAELFLAPQIYRITLQWAAIYEIGTLFFTATVAIPQVVVYRDRLPFFPYAYVFQTSFNPVLNVNDGAMSYSASRKNAYRQGLAEDDAYQQWSPYFFIILTGRIGGRWLITQQNLPADTLCAVVMRRQNRGPRAPTYIWRRTTRSRPTVPIDFGQLNTSEVLGFGILDSDIFADGSIFPIGVGV